VAAAVSIHVTPPSDERATSARITAPELAPPAVSLGSWLGA
jgi:hypothetical protein